LNDLFIRKKKWVTKLKKVYRLCLVYKDKFSIC